MHAQGHGEIVGGKADNMHAARVDQNAVVCTDAASSADRFHFVMHRIVGRRITFRQLCAIDGAGFMGID